MDLKTVKNIIKNLQALNPNLRFEVRLTNDNKVMPYDLPSEEWNGDTYAFKNAPRGQKRE